MRTLDYDVVEIGTKFAVRQTHIQGFWIFKTKEVEFLDTKYAEPDEAIRFACTWSTLDTILKYCLFDKREDASTLCVEAMKFKDIIGELKR